MRSIFVEAGGVAEITPAELWRVVRDGEALQLVDVRTRLEYRRGHIAGSVSSPLHTLRRNIERLDLDRDLPVVAVCKTAHRSVPAVKMLRARGFRAGMLAGGIDMWRSEGFDLDTATTPPHGEQQAGRIRRRLNAATYDRFTARLEDALMREVRAQLLSDLVGPVLEIGAGTGANLAYYPDSVTRLDLVEVDPYMAARLRPRIAGDVELHIGSAQQLPYGDAAYAAVVSTLTLCSVRDVAGTLAEVRRVLQPDGRLVFAEHVRSQRPRWGMLQDRLTPPWRWLSGGCTINRDTLAHLEQAGFRVETTGSVEFGRRAVIRDFKWGRASPQVRP